MGQRLLLSLAVVLSTQLHGVAAKDVFSIQVKRIEQDLYQDLSSKVIIVTQYCYQYGYREEAVLIIDGYQKKIIFTDAGTSCDIKNIIAR
jgi:hypothetical protein